MASNAPREGQSNRGRNRRFLENLQKTMGAPAAGGLRKAPKPKVADDESLPKSLTEFLEILNAEKRDLSLIELAEFYRQRYNDFSDDDITAIAESILKIGNHCEAIYDFVGFLNVAFVDERFQEKLANEFVLYAANLFDQEEPELETYEQFGRFIGLLLKTKFNRPYHKIIDSSNKLMVAVMNVLLMFLGEVPNLIESDDPEDLERAKFKTVSVICAVKALNRRLFMDYYELNDNIYKFLRSVLIDTDGKTVGKQFRKLLLDVLIEMEKYSVAGAPNSSTNVGTQTIE
jgi:hypothetical protein